MLSLYYKAFYFLDNSQPTQFGIYFSLFLHLCILLFAIGLPDFFKPNKILIPQVIPIEILNISDVTSLTPKKENIDIENKKTKKMKQKKFNSSDNTEIKKIDLQEKPIKKIVKNENISSENIQVQKPDLKKIPLKEKQINNLKEVKAIKLDNIETFKVNKIKPKLKPKALEKNELKNDIKIENKIKPSIKQQDDQKKIIDKPKLIQKPEPDFNLSTMLKDLRNEDIINDSNNKVIEEEELKDIEEYKAEENLEISISEIDLVLQQLRGCFNPRAGTEFQGNEIIKISAKIDKQTYVRTDTVQIVDTNISKGNPYYEAITESAIAIFYNPLCSKLKLPLNKYEEWKNLTINVDYSWMKN